MRWGEFLNKYIYLKIESLFSNIKSNTHSLPHIKERLIELQEICESIKDSEIYNDLTDVIRSIESGLKILNEVERNQFISAKCNEAKNLIFSLNYKRLNQLQNELEQTNTESFYIISYDGFNLVLAGSFDSSYYHEIEITFSNVDFIHCPGSEFTVRKFRLATNEEIDNLNKCANCYEKGGFVVCMEDPFRKDKHYIVAHQVQYNWGMVYYYNRKDLKHGERIAEWVKLDSE